MARIILVISLLLLPYTGWTCSCGRARIRKSFRSVNAVFTGIVLTRVVSHHTDTLGMYQGRYLVQSGQQVQFTFLVHHIYKGTIKADTVSLMTTADGADCGSNFLLSNSYLVYSWFSEFRPYDFTGRLPKVASFLTTSICSRTKPNRLIICYEKLILWLL